MKKKPLTRVYTREELLSYYWLPARQKLEWLEAANRFTYHALGRRKRKIWEAFRRGDL